MPKGDHAEHKDPIKVDQLLMDGSVIRDYDQRYKKSEIKEALSKVLGEVHSYSEKLSYVDLKGTRGESSVFYYVVKGHEDALILASNISYLGKPHPEYKKRMQIPYKWRVFVERHAGKRIIFLGIYHYNDVVMFATFSASAYAALQSVNTSANISLFDLAQGLEFGYFTKRNKFGFDISTIHPDKLELLLFDNPEVPDPPIVAFVKQINKHLPFNQEVFGLDAYKEMVEANFPYRCEKEWPGFYLEYLFDRIIRENNLTDSIEYLGRGEMDIDLFVRSENCYSDLKSTNIDYRELLCNKITTTEEILEKYGQMYYLVYPYTCEMDIEHNKVVAKYAAEMMDKPTDEEYVSYEKKMKYSVTYKGMFILKVDKSNKDYLLKKGEVSGGRVKYKISAKNLDNFILYREGKISKKELIDTRIDVEE